MKLSILDAIERYKSIHASFCDELYTEQEAQTHLEKLQTDCASAGLVFAPKVSDLYDHAKFNTGVAADDDEDEDESSSSDY